MDVELEIGAGEVVALTGDEAAGRSTLVKRLLGIATVHQDLAMCDDLDAVGNPFPGPEIHRLGVLDEVETGHRTREPLRTPSIRIPGVRGPVAALSGGQRQVVAITRSLRGTPGLLLPDEPTASLGAEQTGQRLDLLEELRDRGIGVLLISHDMGDIKAGADRVAVPRLGRNNGFLDVDTAPQEQIISSITGAADNASAHRPTRPEEAWQ